jgi:hypothetical protein
MEQVMTMVPVIMETVSWTGPVRSEWAESVTKAGKLFIRVSSQLVNNQLH